MIENDNNDDLNLDLLFDNESDFTEIFDQNNPFSEDFTMVKSYYNEETEVSADNIIKARKRSLSDFEPDMDALLITAQSSMIIEGLKFLSNKNFSSKTIPIYIESLKGVTLYIKILDRNPNNYLKLKDLINLDLDCQRVEKTAYDLYEITYNIQPKNNREKLIAFEKLRVIFVNAVKKAKINKSLNTLKKYFFISGGLNKEKIINSIKNDIHFNMEIKDMQEQLSSAINIIKNKNGVVFQGITRATLNQFIIMSSGLLSFHYELQMKKELSNYYYRINNIYKKYYIIQ